MLRAISCGDMMKVKKEEQNNKIIDRKERRKKWAEKLSILSQSTVYGYTIGNMTMEVSSMF